MSELRKAAQQALEALESAKMNHGKMLLSDPPQEAWRFHRVDETLSDAITALKQALAEPQTTHWEGCEAVHPECKAKTELERKSDAIQRLWKERDELRSENRTLVRQNGEWQEFTAELVEALRCADAMLSGANMDAKAVERKVSAALAKVEKAA